ncbi:hypothetical protein NU08_2122 [Flavobacterium anhuiense]|uniref:Uncharacterized protein n=2 Tax=Flavobacterium anhuiense TaxID=459526 RepID=A0A444VZ83_9FLAO|nr:hypothetical protein NU08_2122 [Flavobacterium anhuiense]
MDALSSSIENSIGNRREHSHNADLAYPFYPQTVYELYCVQGSIGPVAMHHNLDLHLKKHEPFFRLVAAGNDIVE